MDMYFGTKSYLKSIRNHTAKHAQTLKEAKPAFDDPTPKEAMESLTSTKSHEETYQTNKQTHP